MPNCHCSATVFDSTTRKYRKCKLTKVKGLNIDFCRIHVYKYVRKIQAVWKGFLCRRRLNVFKNLPYDVWDIVLYHTKKDYNISKKYIPSILRIYQNRLTDYNKQLNDLNNRVDFGENIIELKKNEIYKKANITRSMIVKFGKHCSYHVYSFTFDAALLLAH